MPRLRSKMAPQSSHEHLNPSTAVSPPKVTAYIGEELSPPIHELHVPLGQRNLGLGFR